MTQLVDRPAPAHEDRASTLRLLAGVAMGPAVTFAALVAAAVLVVLVADGGDFAGAGAVSAAVWLGAHQVPLTLAGAPLGVLPLLPTLVLALVTGRSVRAAVRASGWTGDRVLALAAAAVLGPVLLGVLAVVLLADRPSLLPVGGVVTAPALLVVALVHAAGAVPAVAVASGRVAQARAALPPWAARSAALVPRALLGLLSGGALLVALSLVVSFTEVGRLYGADPSVGTVLGLTLVSLLYLPNLVVAATSVAVGPGAELGQNTVTAFGTVGGPVPPVPLLGGLPATSSSWLWLLVLAVPLAVGVLVGLGSARRASDPTEAARTALGCAAVTGVVVAVLGWLAGGRLGGAAFDPVAVPAGLLGVLTAVWLGLVGAGTAGALVHRAQRVEDETVAEDEDQAEEVAEVDDEVEPAATDATTEPERAPAAESETDPEPAAESEPAAEADVEDGAAEDKPATPEPAATADAATPEASGTAPSGGPRPAD